MTEVTSQEVIKQEKEVLGLEKGEQPVGLALSGGGIRSASFAIGVMQALNEAPDNKIKKLQFKLSESFDYLSSVSGGGYAALAYSWLRGKKGKDFFPFARDQKRDGVSGQKIMAFLRYHGKFLIPTKSLNLLAAGGVVIRGALVSASFYFAFLILVMLGLILISPKIMDMIPEHHLIAEAIEPTEKAADKLCGKWMELIKSSSQDCDIKNYSTPTDKKPDIKNNVFSLGIIITILSVVGYLAAILFNLLIRFIYYVRSNTYITKYTLELWSTIAGGKFIGGIFFGLVIALIPLIHMMLHAAIIAVGPVGLISGILAAIAQYRKNASKIPFLASFPKTGHFSTIIGAALFILALLVVSYDVAGKVNGNVPLLYVPVGIMLFIGLLNINQSALGRFYRDRLMEIFMPTDTAVNSGEWLKNDDADQFELYELNRTEDGKFRPPYHLVNCNVVLNGSKTAKYRSRLGDSFLLSPLYVGSDATEYIATKDFIRSGKGRGMTVATAMSTSGAAVNPNTGVGGQGVTTNRLISIIMIFFNIRLGYWAPNPREQGVFGWRRKQKRARYLRPGIQSILGLNHNEKDNFVELSDGGHFDNLGLYELIRRRCKLIIASDAGADPDFKFEDLTTALKRVRADFGCDIRFKKNNLDISNLIPGSADTKPAVLGKLFKTALKGYALGSIVYADKSEGIILYLKTTITPGLPADLYGYKAAHPKFPDEPTSDQFFNERQFESYRELGYQITYAALTDKDVLAELKNMALSKDLETPQNTSN